MSQITAFLSAPELHSRIAALLLTSIGTLVFRWIRPSPKVVWGISHGFDFLTKSKAADGSPLIIRTGTVFVQNVGRAAAKDIEVHLNFPPEELHIWPTLDYTTTPNPENRLIIGIKSLGKREWFTIEMISGQIELPDTLRVRTPDGECKRVQMAPMEVLPIWKIRFLWLLIMLGVFAIIQNAIYFAGWLLP